MKLLQSSGLAALLILSVVAMSQPAHAQSFTLSQEQQIKITYKNGGGTEVLTDYTDFHQYQLTRTAGKEIDFFEFTTFIISTVDITVNSATVTNANIQVLNAQGNYVTVPTTGRDSSVLPYLGAKNIWKVWYLKVQAGTIDSLIGQRTSDKSIDIRFSNAGITMQAKVGLATGNYQASSARAVVIFTAKQGGLTDPNPCPTCEPPVGDEPTGKIYYRITGDVNGEGTGGTFNIDSADIGPFSLAVQGNGTPLETMYIQVFMHLDRSIYQLPPQLKFADSGAIGNFDIFVNGGTRIPVQQSPYGGQGIQRIGGTDDYRILGFGAKRSDVEPLIMTEIGNDGTNIWKEGTITFQWKHATITATTSSGSYVIDVPEQHISLDLVTLTPIDPPGPCEINGAQNTDCDPDPSGGGSCGLLTPMANALNTDCGMAIVIAGTMGIGTIGGVLVVYSKARSRRKKGPSNFRDRLSGY